MTLHHLYPCTNPACDRLTTATWCCDPCQQAELGTAGLTHTALCDKSHSERGPSSERQRIMHQAAGLRKPATG